MRVGGRLQAFLPAWAAITDDAFVLSVIRGGFSIELPDPLPGGAFRLGPPRMSPPHEAGHSGGSTRAMYTGGRGESRRPPSALPLPRLSCSQALGKISADSKPEENQPAYQPVTLQDGNTEVHPPPAQTRGLDCVHRPKGSLPSRTYRSRIQGRSRLRSSRKRVLFQGATVRPKARTTPVHKARSVRGSLPQAAGPAGLLLPRRLASSGRIPGSTVPPAALPTTDSAGPGLYSKLGEVGAYALTAPELPRSRHRSAPPAGAAQPRQGVHDHSGRTIPAPPPTGSGQDVAPIPGVSSEPSRCATGLPAAHAPATDTPAQALPSLRGCPHTASAPSPDHPPTSPAMVAAEFSDYGQPPPGAPALYHGDHRCLPAGMGWSLPGQYGLWGLVPYGHTRPHQYAGVSSCPLTPLILAPAAPAHSAHTHGQCHCGGLYKQTGGHSLHAIERPSGATVDVVQTRGDFPHGFSHPRPGQPHSGLPVPGPSPSLGVDPPPVGHGPDSARDRPVGGGSVRVRAQCTPPEVLLQGSGPSSLEDRRLLLPMEGVPGLCIPADLPHPPRSAEDSGGSSVGGAYSTTMAGEELVPRPDRPTIGVPEDPAPTPGLNSAADIAGLALSAERLAPDCVAIIRKVGTQAGLSDRAAALVASSRRESTCESYNSHLAGYFQ